MKFANRLSCIIFQKPECNTLYLFKGEFVEKNVEISILLDFYSPLLTKTQRLAIREHYDEDQSFGEIGERLGKSRQAVHDAVSKGVTALYAYEAKLGTMKRYLAFDKRINELQKIADGANNNLKQELQKAIEDMQKLWEENDGI